MVLSSLILILTIEEDIAKGTTDLRIGVQKISILKWDFANTLF